MSGTYEVIFQDPMTGERKRVTVAMTDNDPAENGEHNCPVFGEIYAGIEQGLRVARVTTNRRDGIPAVRNF